MAKFGKVLSRLTPRGERDEEQPSTTGSSGSTGTGGSPTSHPLWPRPQTNAMPPLQSSKPLYPRPLGTKVLPNSRPAQSQGGGTTTLRPPSQGNSVFQQPAVFPVEPVFPNPSPFNNQNDRPTNTRPETSSPTTGTIKPTPKTDDWGRLEARELTPEEWAQLSPAQQSAVLFNTQAMQAYEADLAAGENVYDSRLALQEALHGGPTIEQEFRDRIRLLSGKEPGEATVSYSDLPIVQYDELFDAEGHVRTTDPNEIISIARTDRQRLVNSLAAQVEEYLAQTPAAVAEIRFDNPTAQADYEGTLQQMLDPAVLNSYNWDEAQMFLRQSGYDPEDFRSYVMSRIAMYTPAEGQTTREQLRSWFGQE